MNTDDFTRADSGTLGANWTTAWGQWSIGSNKAVPTSVTENVSFYNGTFANDQTSECTLSTPDDGGPIVRASGTTGGTRTFYLFAARPGTSTLYRVVNDSYTSLGTYGGGFSANDVAKLEVVGTNLTAYKNGVSVITASDSNIASGSPGMHSYFTNTRVSLWTGTGAGASAIAAIQNFLRQMRN